MTFGSSFLGIGNGRGANGGKNQALASGYEHTQVKGGHNTAKAVFQEQLNFDLSQSTETSINNSAAIGAEYKAMAIYAGKQSQQSLEAARQAENYRRVLLTHTQAALSLEVQHQKTTKDFLQNVTPSLLDLGIVQNQHAGFSTYSTIATDNITF